MWYVIFADEQAGGYGHWLFNTQKQAEEGLEGEKFLREITIGEVPISSSRSADAYVEGLIKKLEK